MNQHSLFVVCLLRDSASAVVSEGNIKQSPSSGAKKATAKGQKSESGEEVIKSEIAHIV